MPIPLHTAEGMAHQNKALIDVELTFEALDHRGEPTVPGDCELVKLKQS